MEALGRHLRDSHTTQHADPTTEERVRNWYIWKRIKGASRERQYILKKGRRGHICLWKGKNAAPKITSRGIIYHCCLYHVFWQREMAWSQIGSLLAFFGIFCPLCVLSKRTYADTFTLLIHTHTYTTGGDWQLAVSAK